MYAAGPSSSEMIQRTYVLRTYVHTSRLYYHQPRDRTGEKYLGMECGSGGGGEEGGKQIAYICIYIYIYTYSSYIKAKNWENGIFFVFSIHLITFCDPYISKLFILKRGPKRAHMAQVLHPTKTDQLSRPPAKEPPYTLFLVVFFCSFFLFLFLFFFSFLPLFMYLSL